MSIEEKQFAIDLLRALDEGLGDNTQAITDSHYQEVFEGCRKETKKTVEFLISLGYKKCSTSQTN